MLEHRVCFLFFSHRFPVSRARDRLAERMRRAVIAQAPVLQPCRSLGRFVAVNADTSQVNYL